MDGRSIHVVRLLALLLVGSLTLPADAAPGLPLTDPFGVRFTPVPVRMAPIQGRPLRVLRVPRLGSLKFSPDRRFLAFSRVVVFRKPQYVFDGRTLRRSNDYPSLFAADIDPGGRLVAFAYRTRAADRLVVAELAR